MRDWAKNEVDILLGGSSDKQGYNDRYASSCYMSAYKAYESLCNDGHSGMSFALTRDVLIRLLYSLPLSPIQDEDFFRCEMPILQDNRTLEKQGLKSSLQCPRMSSLFREETLDGKVKYKDVRRAVFVDIENNDSRWGCFSLLSKFVDDNFPIMMPYYPPVEKYVVYGRSFLVDKNLGDFDTISFLYIKMPDGKELDINEYYNDKGDGFKRITKEEYDKLYDKKIIFPF